jgi:hypothetical protein
VSTPVTFQGLEAFDAWRAAGVSFEDRRVLLGHKATHVTMHYSAADIGALIAAANRVCEVESRKSPALAIVRAQATVTTS